MIHVVTTLVFGSHHLHISCKRTWCVGADSYLCLQSKSLLFPFLKSSLPLASIVDALRGRNHKGDTKPPQCSGLLACLEAGDSACLRRCVQRGDETGSRRFVRHCPIAAARQSLHDSQQAHLISVSRSSRYTNTRCTCALYHVPATRILFLPVSDLWANSSANPARSRRRLEPFKEHRNIERKNTL
jgi:hypothetical protein